MNEYEARRAGHTDSASGPGPREHANIEGIPGYGANGTPAGTEGAVYRTPIPGMPVQNTTAQLPPPPVTPPPTPPQSQNGFQPPGGTYPNRFQPVEPPAYPLPPPAYRGAPGAASPAPAADRKKGRRVGTFTLAICLILVGILLVMRIVLPALDYTLAARLSPLILVLLGAEILIANIRHKDEKLYYDGLSIFICIVVIGATLILATIPAAFQAQIDAGKTANRLSAEMEDKTSAILANEWGGMYSVDWYIDLTGTSYSTDMALSDIKPSQYVQMRVYFGGDFKDAETFARACHKVAEQVSKEVPHVDYASFYSERKNATGYQGDKLYYLVIENRNNFDASPESLTGYVQEEYWHEDGYYMSDWEYQNRLNNPEAFENQSLDDSPNDLAGDRGEQGRNNGLEDVEDPEVPEAPENVEPARAGTHGLRSETSPVFFSYPEAI